MAARPSRRREARASAEDPRVPVSAANFLEVFGGGLFGQSAAGITVTIDNALGVPAVSAAVNFLSATLASLPIYHFRRRGEDRQRQRGNLATLLQDAVNDETSSYAWRRAVFDAVFTGGRSFTFIETAATGRVMNLWHLDPAKVTVKRLQGRTRYFYEETGSATKEYAASEIIDIAFMKKSDGLSHRGPIATAADVIGLAIAATQYASKYFQNGGIPAFAVVGKFQTPAGMQRAADQLSEAVVKAAKEKRQALVLPEGLTITPLGADPNKSQMVETHRFLVEQIARIYGLPPVFLQDLTHGTFSNTEQQDLHFVKHKLLHHVDQFEQELNLKLFGRSGGSQWVEMNVDGILRGDFKTRMDGLAQAVMNGILTPNEARRLDNRPTDDPAADRLYMQGAMVPLGTVPGAPPAIASNPSDPQPADGGSTNASAA